MNIASKQPRLRRHLRSQIRSNSNKDSSHPKKEDSEMIYPITSNTIKEIREFIVPVLKKTVAIKATYALLGLILAFVGTGSVWAWWIERNRIPNVVLQFE